MRRALASVAPSVAVVLLLAGASAALCVDVLPAVEAAHGLLWARVVVAVALTVLALWSYVATALHGSEFGRRGLTAADLEAPPVGVTVKRSTGAPRWCNKCDAPKPDRCHHCSRCGTCVLRMDHHCPWIMDRCIGARNQKSFVLFLAYASALCVYVLASVVEAGLWHYAQDEDAPPPPLAWVALGVLSLVFTLVLVPFTLFHVYLLVYNRTTLEYMEGASRVRFADQDAEPAEGPPPVEQRLLGVLARGSEDRASAPERPSQPSETTRLMRAQRMSRAQNHEFQRVASQYNLYDVGLLGNLRQVLGRHWWLWWAPLNDPDTDGVHYPINEAAWTRLQDALRCSGVDEPGD